MMFDLDTGTLKNCAHYLVNNITCKTIISLNPTKRQR